MKIKCFIVKEIYSDKFKKSSTSIGCFGDFYQNFNFAKARKSIFEN